MTGNQKDKVPLNSVQKAKQKQKTSVKANPVVGKSPQNTRAPTPEPQPNYLSDSKYEEDSEDNEATVKQSNCSRSPRTVNDEDWDVSSIHEPHPEIRRSKHILQQIRDSEKEGLHRIAALAEK